MRQTLARLEQIYRVSKVVRVGARSIFELLDQNSREVGDYSAIHAESTEEAESLLDQLTHRR